MHSRLPDQSLSQFFIDADAKSNRGQSAFIRLNSGRLILTVIAALSAALAVGTTNVWGLVAAISFLLALGCELWLLTGKHEKQWYEARAAAESAKTLSWRFVMRSDPFDNSISDQEAEDLYRNRIGQVARQVIDSIDAPTGNSSAASETMTAVRRLPFETRRTTYIQERTNAQKNWYAQKAKDNRRYATLWRSVLLLLEVVAVILAFGRYFDNWPIDIGGILATAIGAGAAWLSLRQHYTLSTAYALTAVELDRQLTVLQSTHEDDWSKAVADAEEAISREHTMWLASRGQVNESLGS
jgi:hypothetical protein